MEAKPSPAVGRNKYGPLSSSIQGIVMRVHSGRWLDYDPIAVIVLIFGLGAVALLALII